MIALCLLPFWMLVWRLVEPLVPLADLLRVSVYVLPATLYIGLLSSIGRDPHP